MSEADLVVWIMKRWVVCTSTLEWRKGQLLSKAQSYSLWRSSWTHV